MNDPQSTDPIIVEPLSLLAAWASAGTYGLVLLVVIGRSWGMVGGDFVSIAMAMAVMLCPLLIMASKLGVQAHLFSDRIEVKGFLTAKKTYMLADCTAARCSAGRAFARSITLRFGRRGHKVMLSNTRRGFWTAAESLKESQETHDWVLKYGIKDEFRGHFWLPEDERGIKWI